MNLPSEAAGQRQEIEAGIAGEVLLLLALLLLLKATVVWDVLHEDGQETAIGSATAHPRERTSDVERARLIFRRVLSCKCTYFQKNELLMISCYSYYLQSHLFVP